MKKIITVGLVYLVCAFLTCVMIKVFFSGNINIALKEMEIRHHVPYMVELHTSGYVNMQHSGRCATNANY